MFHAFGMMLVALIGGGIDAGILKLKTEPDFRARVMLGFAAISVLMLRADARHSSELAGVSMVWSSTMRRLWLLIRAFLFSRSDTRKTLERTLDEALEKHHSAFRAVMADRGRGHGGRT